MGKILEEMRNHQDDALVSLHKRVWNLTPAECLQRAWHLEAVPKGKGAPAKRDSNRRDVFDRLSPESGGRFVVESWDNPNPSKKKN
jgi:hypothetical protein